MWESALLALLVTANTALSEWRARQLRAEVYELERVARAARPERKSDHRDIWEPRRRDL